MRMFKKKLDLVCEMYKEEVKNKITIICENQQQIVNEVKDVVGEVENQLTMNNNRSNKQEDMLKAIGEAVLGLRDEMQINRTNHQILKDKQEKIEHRMEEERRVTNETLQKNTNSVQAQGEALQDWFKRGHTIGVENPSNEPKTEVKKENAPPGLIYGVAEQRFFDQGERKTTPFLTQKEKDTDSIMTERGWAQEKTRIATTS